MPDPHGGEVAGVSPRLVSQGRPRPLPPPSAKRKLQGKPLSWELYSEHPGYGLNPDRVWKIFTLAEYGYPQSQVDLFEDLIENDGHLRALSSTRLNAVAGKSWVIQPGGRDSASIEGAQALSESLRRRGLNFLDALEHQLEGVPFGYAGTEIEWDYADGLFVPAWFHNVAHRRFIFPQSAGMLRILTEEEQAKGEELERGHWIVNRQRHTNPARAGLMRTATWFAMFKRFSIRDWVIAAEKFGIPPVLGYYQENASPEARAALDKAVRDIGEAGHATLSELTNIVFGQTPLRSGQFDALHPMLVAMCEQQMSKLFTGAVLTADTGPSNAGSWALGKVHQNVRSDLIQADARRLGEVFREHLGAPWMEWNGFPGAPPTLKLQIVQEVDQATRISVMEKAQQMGFPLDPEQVAEEMALRPAGDGSAMQPLEQTPDPAEDDGGEDVPVE